MQLNDLLLNLHVSGFNCAEFQNVIDEPVHPGSVLLNDGKEAAIVFTVIDRAGFKGLGQGNDRSQRRAQLMRNVREKLLANQLQSFQPRDVKEDADGAVRRLTISRLQVHTPPIYNTAFAAEGF